MTKKIVQIIDDAGVTSGKKKGEVYEVDSIVGQYYCLKNGQYIPVSQTRPVKCVKKDKYEVGDLVEIKDESKGVIGFSVAVLRCVDWINNYVSAGNVSFHKNNIKHAIVKDDTEVQNETKKGHPHAAVIMEYAKIAQEHEHPETWVEIKVHNDWVRLSRDETPWWCVTEEYRISEPPKTWPKIVINGIEVNAPIKDKPKEGTMVFPLNRYYEGVLWKGTNQTLLEELNSGFLFRSREDAIAAFNAAIKPLTDYINLQK